MKKTISINLGGQGFVIEEDSYNKLQAYLEELKRHCGAGADTAEVISDIESGMAEKLKGTLSAYKTIINDEDVESLIKVMGTSEDFDREIGSGVNSTDNSNDKENKKEASVSRKLYRDPDNYILGGVASGLAAYFNIDPLIFRLLFFVSVFAGGFGFVLYILLWLIVPEAKTASQKLEMRGEAPTLAAFESLARRGNDIKENFKKRWQESSILKKIISLPFLAFECLVLACKKIWSKLWPLIRFLFGLGLIIFSLSAVAFLGVAVFYALLQFNSVYRFSYIPIKEIIVSFPFFWWSLSVFFSLFIPAIFLLLSGVIIIRRKNFLNFPLVAVLISIWMIAGISCAALSLRYGPDVRNQIYEYPSLQKTVKNLDLGDIKSINAAGDYLNIVVEPSVGTSTKTQIAVSGRAIDLNKVEIKNNNGELVIKRQYIKDDAFCINCNDENVTVKISAPNLINLKTKGANLDVSGNMASSTFTISEAALNLENFKGQTLNLVLESDARVRLIGEAAELNVKSSNNVDDYSYLNAEKFKADKVSLNLDGSPRIMLGDVKEIKATLSSEAVLYYMSASKLSGTKDGDLVIKYRQTGNIEEPYAFEQGKLASSTFEELSDSFPR